MTYLITVYDAFIRIKEVLHREVCTAGTIQMKFSVLKAVRLSAVHRMKHPVTGCQDASL